MSPYRTNFYGQEIIALNKSETCPISDKDLFADYINVDKIIDVHNSKIYVPNYDIDLIQGCLNNSKNYFEESFLKYVDKYIGENAIIIDIGANIGNHTLYWANESHAKKIYAFEPIPHTFEILKKNIEINNLQDRVKLHNIGLADQECSGEIKCFCKQNIGGTRLKKLQSDTKFTMPLTTLDSFNITEDKVDLIKIDVEGMDNEVLLGSKNTIAKYKPVIVIESFADSFEKTNSILEEYGYKKEHDFGSCEFLYLYEK